MTYNGWYAIKPNQTKLYIYIYIYIIKFRVQENLYKMISKDTIGIDSRGTQIK